MIFAIIAARYELASNFFDMLHLATLLDKLAFNLKRWGGQRAGTAIAIVKRIGESFAGKPFHPLLEGQIAVRWAGAKSVSRGFPVAVGGSFKIGDHEIVRAISQARGD